MTSLNRLADDFGQKGLRLLAISVDEDIYLVREFIRQVPLSFPVLLDPGARLSANDFGIVYYPTTFFVDHHGKIGQIWIGEQNWDAADIRAAIERLLAD